jgi:hypothetical protein
MNFLLARGKAPGKFEAIAAQGINRPKMTIAVRVVGLMRPRPPAPEDRDLVLLRNAEFQIMLTELRYPPIRYL